MGSVNKSLIAAVLAVRQGQLSPERAADLILHPEVPATISDGPGTYDGGTVAITPALVDEVAKRLEAGETLDGLGIETSVVKALSDIQESSDTDSIRHTLLSISPTRAVRGAEDETDGVIDAAEASSETQHPTVLQIDAVSTRKPSSQVLRAVPREERYSVEREHARGGMGRILIARDNIVGRDVALKELLPVRGAGGSTPAYTEESRGLTERFLREAKVTGQLEHPNIVSVYEIGKNEDGSLYYTMRFVRGITLAARLTEIAKDPTLNKKEKLSARLKLLDSFVDVCNAIAFAHSKGVIHRDLKPENVMIGEYGETVVLDWGLARVRGQEDIARDDLVASTRFISRSVVEGETDKLTMDGSIVGTPAYMAPEQARGELDEIDEQTDVYALGAVLYQILCGRAPFEAPVAALIIQQVIHGHPAKLTSISESIPLELEALVERAMAKEKAERLSSAREFASEIKAFRDGRTLSSYQYTARELMVRWVTRHKAAVIAATIIVYLLVSGAVWHYFSLRTERDEVALKSREADEARRSAELAFQEAQLAERRVRQEKDRADQDRREAEAAMTKAREEAEARQRALQGWDRTLADAYAMRVRLAMREKDYNAAIAFAGAALKAAENPEARGALMAWPRIYPLLWQIPADTRGRQEVYEWFAVRHTPDGRKIVTGMPDGRVLVFDLTTGTQAQELQLADAAVWSVAVHPSGEWIAAGDRNGRVGVFQADAQTGEFQQKARLIADLPGNTGGIEFSPSGEWLAVTGNSLHLFRTNGFGHEAEFTGQPNKSPMHLSWSPDGRTILTASPMLDDFFLRVWDVPTRSLRTALLDLEAVNEVYTAWTPDGALVASTSLQGQIRIRDGKDFRVLRTLRSHTSVVLSLAFSPDGRTLVSTSVDGTVRIWDVHTGEETAVLSGFDAWMTAVDFAPDGRSFCARGADGDMRIWAMPDESGGAIGAHGGDVLDVRYSADGKRFITAGWDGAVSVWDVATRARVRRFTVPFRQFFAAAFLPGERVVGVGSDGVRVWSLESGAELAHLAPRTIVTDLAVAGDGSYFIYAQGRSNDVVSCETLKPISELGEHTQIILGCAIAPDNKRVASSANDSTVAIWNMATGERLMQVEMPVAPAYGVAFSPDGKVLATASEDRRVYLWDAETGKLNHTLSGPEGVAFAVKFDSQGRYLFSSSQDRSIRVWDAVEGVPVAVLKGHSETVSRLALSPDGKTLMSGSQDDTVRFWRLADLNEPRESLWSRVEAATGLTVVEKEFRASMRADWPGPRVHPYLQGARRQRIDQAAAAAMQRQIAYEGYRYTDSVLPDGRAVRRYFAPRPIVNGVPQGMAQGRVNYAAWWAERNPDWMQWRGERAVEITEILDSGQAKGLGLRVGDLIWSVNGGRVQNRDELRTAMADVPEDGVPVTIRRYAREPDGTPRMMRAPDGSLLLNDAGRAMWVMEELQVKVGDGSLGLRAADGAAPAGPFR